MKHVRWLVGVLVLAAAGSAQSAELCHELGTQRIEGTPIAVEDLVALSNRHQGSSVLVAGELQLHLNQRWLCSPERRGDSRPKRRCLSLTFALDALGTERSDLQKVLEQWDGMPVRAEGSFHEAESWADSHRGNLEEIQSIGVHEDQARQSYCPGYRGPMAPSDQERAYTAGERPQCRRRSGGNVNGLTAVCLHPYEPIVLVAQKATIKTSAGIEAATRVGWRQIPIAVPAPYAGRDIWEFKALDEDVYVFTLVNDQLYGWRDGALDELDGSTIDQLRADEGRGEVYYRSRSFREDGSLSSNALRRVDADLRVETVWESRDLILERVAWTAATAGIWVRDGDEVKVLEYDPDRRAWSEREDG